MEPQWVRPDPLNPPNRYKTTRIIRTSPTGRTLFHCHQQLHMDFGFMALFDYL